MTKVKFCGLSRECDIKFANELKPDYIGFIFWEKSKRYIDFQKAEILKKILIPEIQAVGVFVDELPEKIADLANNNIIDVIQLHGHENNSYIEKLRSLTNKPIIQAFKISSEKDVENADSSIADYVLLDEGKGSGKNFDWNLIGKISRDYFLAGGLNPDNIEYAIKSLKPFAVDVSSGIETNSLKDKSKMKDFISKVRNFF